MSANRERTSLQDATHGSTVTLTRRSFLGAAVGSAGAWLLGSHAALAQGIAAQTIPEAVLEFGNRPAARLLMLSTGSSRLESVGVTAATPAGLALRPPQVQLVIDSAMTGDLVGWVQASLGPKPPGAVDLAIAAYNESGVQYRTVLKGSRLTEFHVSLDTDAWRPNFTLGIAPVTASQQLVVPPGPLPQGVPARLLWQMDLELFVEGLETAMVQQRDQLLSARLTPEVMDPATGSRWAMRLDLTCLAVNAGKLLEWHDLAVRGQMQERAGVLRFRNRSSGLTVGDINLERIGPLDVRFSGLGSSPARVHISLYCRKMGLKLGSMVIA